jgi:hypothetical protein
VRISSFQAVSFSFCLVALSVSSCSFHDPTPELRKREAKAELAEVQTTDELSSLLHSLPLLGRFDRDALLREFTNSINAWGNSKPQDSAWKKTELVTSLAQPVQAFDFAQRLDRFQLGAPESEFLWQCRLFQDISNWVLDAPYQDTLFAPWLSKKKESLPAQDALKLEQTLKLFDWTIRNIALEGEAKAIEKPMLDPIIPDQENTLGCRTLPWQTAIFGHGDAIQRIRVFTQLLFQQKIEAVCLAIEAEASPSKRHLWAIGVPIGDELYLFEPRLGLPMPIGDEAGVATLRMATEDPSILRRAKVPGRFDYAYTSSDLARVVALLDVEPFSVGYAMHVIEESLAGQNRMRLACDPEQIRSELSRIAPSIKMELWSNPWLAHGFNLMVRQQVYDKTPFGLKYQVENGAYIYDTILSNARLAHFRGQFETSHDVNGAPNRYMTSRVDEASLEKLPFDQDTQQRLQVIRMPSESQNDFQNRVSFLQKSFRLAKHDSHFFLGALQFDIGNWDSSIDWLDKRLMRVAGTERWRPQARYLIGRAFEQKADIKKSIEWLKSEGVPQEAGNRIRARLIEKRVDLGSLSPRTHFGRLSVAQSLSSR